MKHYKIIFVLFLSLIITSCKNDKNTSDTVEVIKPKNVLFIAVDDLKPLLGCYGDSIVKTPNIDKLASQGFVMDNNHCQQAVCGPSRASILTGKRPDYTQVWDLKTLIRDMNPDIVTMPQYFKQNGYTTIIEGKIFDYRSVDKGNDSISWSNTFDNFKHNSDLGQDYRNAKDRVPYEILQVDDTDTPDGEVARRTVNHLRELAKSDKPFFMAAGFYKPHLPFNAPQKYWDMYDASTIKLPDYRKAPEGAPSYATQPSWELRNYDHVEKDYSIPLADTLQLSLKHAYYACTSFVDAQIGKVLDELDALGLRENTIIVLWGDHGYHLGDHDMWCKHTNYEQSTKTPLIFVDGKNTGRVMTPTEFVDVYPTLCELAGVKTPENLDGVSLTPLFENTVKKVKDFAVSQFPRDDNKMGYAFRNDRYRYVVWFNDEKPFESNRTFDESTIDAEEFYDYQTDPEERKNLINEAGYQTVKNELKAQAKAFFNKL